MTAAQRRYFFFFLAADFFAMDWFTSLRDDQ
jgi:hypothetical protein